MKKANLGASESLGRGDIEYIVKGYKFRSHRPPNVRAIAVHEEMDLRIEVYVKAGNGGLWWMWIHPSVNINRFPRKTAKHSRRESFWDDFLSPEQIDRESLEFHSKEEAMDWIANRLEKFGFSPG